MESEGKRRACMRGDLLSREVSQREDVIERHANGAETARRQVLTAVALSQFDRSRSACYGWHMRRTLRAFRIVLMAYVAYGIIYRFPC